MKFLKLLGTKKEKTLTILLNVELVSYIEGTEDSTSLHLKDGNVIEVLDSIESIEKQLN